MKRVKSPIIKSIMCLAFIGPSMGKEVPNGLESSPVVGTTTIYRVDHTTFERITTPPDVRSISVNLSMEILVEVMSKNDIEIRMLRIVTGDTQEKPTWNHLPKSSVVQEKLGGISFVLTNKGGHWHPRGLKVRELPEGGDLLMGFTMEKVMPLIFPPLPDQFEPRVGYEWGEIEDENKQGKILFESDAKILRFKVYEIYDILNLHPVAVIKGEQRYIRNEGTFDGSMAHSLQHIEYDIGTRMVREAIERSSLKMDHRGKEGVPNSVKMEMTTITQIPKK